MAARILVVEEESALAEAVAFRLGADGFQVEHCATGAEALAAGQGQGFDLFHELRAVCPAPMTM